MTCLELQAYAADVWIGSCALFASCIHFRCWASMQGFHCNPADLHCTSTCSWQNHAAAANKLLTLVQVANTKYQLPGSNNTFVDLVDDEDVKLMFDEWAEYLAELGKAARNAKLHIYVDYSDKARDGGMPSMGAGHAALDTISETASADTPVARAPPPPTPAEARGAEERVSQENSPMGQSSR